MSNDYDRPSNPYAGEQLAKSAEIGTGRLRNPPVRRVVEDQIKELEKEIKARKELLDAIDANPGVEDVLDRLRKLHI